MNGEYDALKKALGGEERYHAIGSTVHDFYSDGLVASAGNIPEDAMIAQEAIFFAFIQWLQMRSMDEIEMCKGLTLEHFAEILCQFQYIEYHNGVFLRFKPKSPVNNLDVIYSPADIDERDILVTLRPKKN